MFRAMYGVLSVLAALAPMGCATEGGLSRSATDAYGDSAGIATPASRAIPATPPSTEPTTSAADLTALQSQAEDAYRARRFDEALALYQRVLELQPASAGAWLRLGNVHHQRRDWFKAIAAYRRASARTLAGVETEPVVRAKAYYNVALVDLELARQSLRSLERLGSASVVVGDPAPLAREIERTRRRLEAVFSREPTTQLPAKDVDDRPNGAARRTTRRTGDTPVKVDTATKADKPTKIDYIRGEPRP